MKKMLLVFLLFSSLQLAANSSKAQIYGCIPDRELVFSASPESNEFNACNRLSGMYRFGLGAINVNLNNLGGDLYGKFEYYFLIRSYLILSTEFDSEREDDSIFLLIGALAVLDDNGTQRHQLYKAFIISEYRRLKGDNLKYSKPVLEKTLSELMEDGPFGSAEEIRCFIVADFPKFGSIRNSVYGV